MSWESKFICSILTDLKWATEDWNTNETCVEGASEIWHTDNSVLQNWNSLESHGDPFSTYFFLKKEWEATMLKTIFLVFRNTLLP